MITPQPPEEQEDCDVTIPQEEDEEEEAQEETAPKIPLKQFSEIHSPVSAPLQKRGRTCVGL